MGLSSKQIKLGAAGVVAVLLVIAVIVLGVEVGRLSGELAEKENIATTTTTTTSSSSISSTAEPSSTSTTTEVPEEKPWDDEYRLPAGVTPEHYELLLHPDVKKDTFSGHVTLTLTIEGAPQEYLLVHQVNLDVKDATLSMLKDGQEPLPVALKDSFPAPVNQFFVVRPLEPVGPGQYALSLNFSGSLKQPDIVGIYSSQYTNPEGEIRKLVTSKFEPTYARRAFPCMDEPDKKANFTISLVRPSEAGWVALSNMDVQSEEENRPETGLSTVNFKTSVKMSTYLACFIVSDFTHLEGSVGGKLPFRTFAPPHSTSFTQFSLDAGVAVTEFYINYFGIDYPLPKLDLIAIPDFVSGAMEHWGLVTFRETNMIIDPAKSSAANRQQVGMVVAHEIAHMWFGNLVTMKWWDDLWLNEGFASYIEYKGLNAFKPEWRLMEQFLTMDLQPVMALDAQLSSHPIIQPVNHPDEITELFDTISYSKGASVIRMLEDFLSEATFQKGIQDYLDGFKYQNAQTTDLWAALQVAANDSGLAVDVARVMDTWTLQMGLPVVTVALKPEQMTVRQARFLASPGAESREGESPFSYRWDIPLTYIHSGSSEVKRAWFKMEAGFELIGLPANVTWVKLNVGQIGFYRVNYDDNMWAALTEAAKTHVLGPADRSSLLDDAFSLADSGRLGYNVTLTLTETLTVENDYIPWTTAALRFQQLTALMRERPVYPKYKEFLQSLVKSLYETLTWDEMDTDDHITQRLRATIISAACSAELPACLARAGELFSAWISSSEPIKPNLRQLVYVYGMEQSGVETEWKELMTRFRAESDPQERSKLLLGLSSVRSSELLLRFITMAVDESIVRAQDYFTVLQSISDNPVGTSIVWNYVRENWKYLVGRFTLNNRSLGRLIPRITQTFSTEERYKEMEEFFAKYPEAGAGTAARKQALERVLSNIQWLKSHYTTIEEWLNAWQGKKV